MAASLSTPLRNYLADTGSLSDALNLCFLYFYDGPVPVSADDAIDVGSNLLCTMSSGGTGGTWGTAVNGALPKTAAETWDGEITHSGTPTFLRICISTDDGSGAVTTERRWQCTAGGAGTDCPFTDPVFVDNDANRKGLDIAELRIPA
jgi:hypothetical protein